MQLTVKQLKATYSYLRETPPFNKWGLPLTKDIKFSVTVSKGYRGLHISRFKYNKRGIVLGANMEIRISKRVCNSWYKVLATIAHEMCHAKQAIDRKGMNLDVLPWDEVFDMGHGPDFQKLADSVCKIHKFDRSIF